MRWTPGGEVGVVAMANVTYAPTTALAARIHDRVRDDAGPLTPDRSRVAEITDAGAALITVLDRWATGQSVTSDALAATFADNVEPDDSYDRRANATLAFGGLRLERVTPINDARAKAVCTTAAGATATVEFALAPYRPIRVAQYHVTLDEESTDGG